MFDYMIERGFEIDERFCMVCLVVLKRDGKFELLIKYFIKMVELGVEIIVYLMIFVIGCFCKRGEIEKVK